MPIFDIFSRRKKREQQTDPDVYQYDQIPEKLRVQVQHIWNDAIGAYNEPDAFGEFGRRHNNSAWEFIHDTVCREMGLHSLGGFRNPKTNCISYLLQEQDIDNLLDLIEFSFLTISLYMRGKSAFELKEMGASQDAEDAIKELNFRFREAGVGYQFEGNKIVRMDSELIHAEVVRPALRLLNDPRFAGPEEEFRSAYTHYRARQYKDCVTDTLNAFESTMKAICDIKGWSYGSGARATDLVKVLRSNGLLPDYLDKSFDQLIATLSSGLPKVRNEEGGHGQGAQPRQTPPYVAAYALHLAAAKIVLLVEAMEGGS